MDPNNSATWQPSAGKAILALLPLACGQIYLVWLVATQRMTLFDVVLVSVIEMLSITYGGIAFLSPNEKVKSQRFRAQKGMIFMLAFMLYLALTVTTLTLRHAGQKPEGMIFEMTVTLFESLFSPAMLYFIPYLAITAGRALLSAEESDAKMRAWYANQFMPITSSFLALLVTLVVGTMPTIAQAESWPTRLGPLVSVELTALLALFRVVFAAVFVRKMTASDFDKLYADFRSGNDRIAGDAANETRADVADSGSRE